MKLNYNLTGAARKPLIAAISQELNIPAKYCGMPSAAYTIGEYTIDKNGTVSGPDNPALEDILRQSGFGASADSTDTKPATEEPATPKKRRGIMDCLVEALNENAGEGEHWERLHRAPQMECGDGRWRNLDGTFTGARVHALDYADDEPQADDGPATEEISDTDRLTIEMPLDGFTPENLANLTKMVEAKAPLIKAAIGADNLTVYGTSESIQFPWFCSAVLTSDEVTAYTTFISALCKTAKEKKRVTAKEKEIDGNPKYAMRCFLLSIGLIGEQYKTARKILLSRLEGNAAWKNSTVPNAKKTG